jgi:hypothetical protein
MQEFVKVGYLMALGTSGCTSSVYGQTWSTVESVYCGEQSLAVMAINLLVKLIIITL